MQMGSPTLQPHSDKTPAIPPDAGAAVGGLESAISGRKQKAAAENKDGASRPSKQQRTLPLPTLTTTTSAVAAVAEEFAPGLHTLLAAIDNMPTSTAIDDITPVPVKRKSTRLANKVGCLGRMPSQSAVRSV